MEGRQGMHTKSKTKQAFHARRFQCAKGAPLGGIWAEKMKVLHVCVLHVGGSSRPKEREQVLIFLSIVPGRDVSILGVGDVRAAR